MGTSELAIDLRNVQKVYKGKIHALRGIEMRVGRGEVFGLLGPNGAGKSTLVKIMMTVIRPTHAEGTVLGQPVGHKPTLARIGYLPENHRFPKYLTGRQVVEFFAALSNVPRARRKQRAGELIDVVGMKEAADRKVGTYSKGMLQRIGLAQAMASDPDLILLDEPTDGVDPVGRRDIRNVLAELKRRGVSVFINSHLLSELEMVCDRVAIMVYGTVAKQGTLDELALSRQFYEIELVDPNRDVTPLVPVHDAYWVQVIGPIVRVGSADPAAVQPVLDALRRNGLVIKRVQMMRPTLEDLFMEAVQAAGGHPAPTPPGFPPAAVSPAGVVR